MLNAITSLRLPVLFAPVIATLANCSPPLAAPKTTVLVSAVDAPPLSEIKNAEDGMLSPTPSVKAAAALAKYAYTPTAVRPGFNVHAVVAVMLVLPALAALPALSVKFTALAERLSVSDSVKLAFKAIVCAPELSCADAMDTANVIAIPTIATRKSVPVLIVPPKKFCPDRSLCFACPRRPGQRIASRDLKRLLMRSKR